MHEHAQNRQNKRGQTSRRNKVFNRTKKLAGKISSGSAACRLCGWGVVGSAFGCKTHVQHVAAAKPWPCWNHPAASWTLVPIAQSNGQQCCCESTGSSSSGIVSERFHCQPAITCFR